MLSLPDARKRQSTAVSMPETKVDVENNPGELLQFQKDSIPQFVVNLLPSIASGLLMPPAKRVKPKRPVLIRF
jgi:hypothetical protein